ncbi:hypothetical protein DOTSEDRAFT_23491 [Lecanosticta acicola]|uniref:REM-1 domain-containing protein n=1 Tax=Lecanosticta acicola TaxID=111012 RepID=A0AAI9E983_9PEZI|nr:hypothetical protein DOTSEDRAFT_23491 [Lecanosticta acicola]
MPRAAVRVQGARNHTHWFLRGDGNTQDRSSGASSTHSSESVSAYTSRANSEEKVVGSMQAREHPYFDQHDSPGRPQYESYDGSGYPSLDIASSRASSARYSNDVLAQFSKPPPNNQVNGHYSDYDFGPPLDQQQRAPSAHPIVTGQLNDFKFDPSDESPIASHHISLNTKVHERNQDAVGQHLLYETALLDTQSYKILDIDEVDSLKKERARLDQRIEATERKLALERKVKDAAQNLQRLYTAGKKDPRPDTPQSSESPLKGRNSTLSSKRPGSSGSEGSKLLHQTQDELAQSVKKVEELNEQIKDLLNRREVVESRLLRHTAAVLAAQASQPPDNRTDALVNGHRSADNDELELPDPDEFDGIRDILRGKSAPPSKQKLEELKGEHEQQLLSVQERLEHLNSQLRSVITEASRTRGIDPLPEPQVRRNSNGTIERLDHTFSIVETNVKALEQEREENKAHYAQMQDTAILTRNTVEEQLEVLNSKFYENLKSSSSSELVQNLEAPPQAAGHGYQHQLQYLEESLLNMERLLQSNNEVQAKAVEHAQKASEYETTLSGLWAIMVTDTPSGLTPQGSMDDSSRLSFSRGDGSPTSCLKEDFSLPAFSSRVQHLFNIASGAREQQDILRRQIQQQRDLNGKSDMENQAQVEEMQARYDQLASSHNTMQEDLARAMTNHQQAEHEANESRGELMNVMNELDQLRKRVEESQTRQKEVDERHAQISAEREEAVGRHNEIQQEMQDLESEVVRLTTELTIAKADLEGAYGTRKQRQKEAGVAAEEMEALQKLKDQEIADLKKSHEQQIETLRREQADRSKLLEMELQDMTNEFQEMTRESLELEKERGQLEGLIDGLRERCDLLEHQLLDERVKWMGLRSPGGNDPSGPREATSVMVLRQEFKKMMREARVEGVRLIRTEQEERRKLEAEIRKIRQLHTPMSRYGPGLRSSSIATPIHSRLGSTINGVPGTPPTLALSPSSSARETAAG